MIKNKNDLAKKVFDEYQLNGAYKKQVVPTVEAVFDAIAEIISEGDEVNIVGFGKFSPYTRAAHKGTHPQTGEEIEISEVKSIKFKPSGCVRNRIKVADEVRNED